MDSLFSVTAGQEVLTAVWSVIAVVALLVVTVKVADLKNSLGLAVLAMLFIASVASTYLQVVAGLWVLVTLMGLVTFLILVALTCTLIIRSRQAAKLNS